MRAILKALIVFLVAFDFDEDVSGMCIELIKIGDGGEVVGVGIGATRCKFITILPIRNYSSPDVFISRHGCRVSCPS